MKRLRYLRFRIERTGVFVFIVTFLCSGTVCGEYFKVEANQGGPGVPHERMGCAADVCFMVLSTKRPEMGVSYSDVADRLPLVRLCSAKEIVDYLTEFDLEVDVVRAPLTALIPPPGQWNICLNEMVEGPDHWEGVYNLDGKTFTRYGHQNPYALHSHSIPELADRLRDAGGPEIVMLRVRDRGTRLGELTLWLIVLCVAPAAVLIYRVLRSHSVGVSVLLFSCSLCVCSHAATVDGPRIRVNDPSIDLGTVHLDPLRPELEHIQKFIIENVGDEDLQVVDIRKSCGCTEYSMNVMTIPPDSSAELRMTIKIEQGENRSVNLSLLSNSVIEPNKTLSVKFKALKLWGIAPHDISFKRRLGESETTARTVIVEIAKEFSRHYTFSGVNYDSSQLDVAIQGIKEVVSSEIGPEGRQKFIQYRFEVKSLGLPDARGVHIVPIKYNFGETIIEQNVAITLVSPVVSIPEALVLVRDRTSTRKTVRIEFGENVRETSESKISIKRARVDDSDVEFDIREDSPSYIIARFHIPDNIRNATHLEVHFANVRAEHNVLKIPLKLVSL